MPSFLDIPQFRRIHEIGNRFGVTISVFGSVARRYHLKSLHASDSDPYQLLFDLVPFTSDVDLYHSGLSVLNRRIFRAIQNDVPNSECFRWQLFSRDQYALFKRTLNHGPRIPVNCLSLPLSQQENMVDPWGGMEEIKSGTYSITIAQDARRSPLERIGRDHSSFAALNYLKTIAEDGLVRNYEVDNSAWRLLEKSVERPHVFLRLMERSPYLRFRMTYLMLNLYAYARASERLSEFMAVDLFREFTALAAEVVLPFRRLFSSEDLPSAIVSSAHLSHDYLRFGIESFWERWSYGESATAEFLDELARASEENSESFRLGEYQEVVALSPRFPIVHGASPSSGEGEFVHVAIFPRSGLENAMIRLDDRSISAVLLVRDEVTKKTYILPTIGVCNLIRDTLSIRLNCGQVFNILTGRTSDTSLARAYCRVLVLGLRG